MVLISNRWKPDVVVALTAVLSLPLFLYSLGDTYLWQDEAQTALLGRSVLAHGVPMAGHGADSFSAVKGRDEGIAGLYFQISWMQAYVAAASFSMLGQSSWSARVPFALSGWFCVPLVAWAMGKAQATRAAARIAAALVACSVPFIIGSRQARYYALTAVVTLLVVGTYAALSKSVKTPGKQTARHSLWFGAAASLLVFSFDITAIGVLGALALYWLLTASNGSERWSKAFWIPLAASYLLLIAWIAATLTAPSRNEHGGLQALPRRLRLGASYYLGQINAHVVPLPGLLTLAAAPDNRQPAYLLAAATLGGLGGAILSPLRFFRYIFPILPLVMGLLAIGLASMWSRGRWSKAIVAAFLLLLLTSNALFVWSHVGLAAIARASRIVTVRDRVMEYRVPLAQLFHEFRDPPRGPIAATIEYLRQNAGAQDVLVTTYGDLPLKFHSRLEVYGGETGQLPPSDVTADWIWPRNLKLYEQVRPTAEWMARELLRGNYRPIQLPAVDRRWENREDPELHIFSNPGPDGPPVILYKLSKAAE